MNAEQDATRTTECIIKQADTATRHEAATFLRAITSSTAPNGASTFTLCRGTRRLLRRRTELNVRNRPSDRAFKQAQKKIASGDLTYDRA